jgi:zinc D-Ala-D-Ala dipeptidase
MKPYSKMAIADNQDPLILIPDSIHRLTPHPYLSLGAPYGDKSPFYLRSRVIEKLMEVNRILAQLKSGYQITVYDAYRPVVVQQFMVIHAYQDLIKARELDPLQISNQQKEDLMQDVYQFWAIPSYDLASPPPHSTGAAVDVTFIDEARKEINMGSAIDLISPLSHPNYFQEKAQEDFQQYHRDRQLLNQAMTSAGFQRHPNEWWHFSWGDQMWAWLTEAPEAFYGRV